MKRIQRRVEVVGLEVVGDPANLRWAVFEFAAEVHAIEGYFTAGVMPEWPSDHRPDAMCPCRPVVHWYSDAAPRPLYEHRKAATA